jgi:hypothetical protein
VIGSMKKGNMRDKGNKKEERTEGREGKREL